jgi:arylsulfatase A-like enzyme
MPSSKPALAALIALSTFALPSLVGAADPAPAHPNIVVILADDLGWRDLGCTGSTFYETPHLDALAASGIRFTDSYAACCVCSPTRASLLTGKYPARLHLTDWIPGGGHGRLVPPPFLQQLPLEEATVAEALKEAGYATGFFGKWHLGGEAFYPDRQGFDLNIGGCDKGHPPSYFSPYHLPTLADGATGEYLTDRLADEALRFLDQAKGRPFLLYLAHYAVHNPQQAKAGSIARFRAKAAALPAHAEFAPEGERRCRQVQDQPVYAAMVASLDDSVGRVMARIATLGLARDTIVIFTSDNGGLSTAEGSPTSNVPLRGGKGWQYEGGLRVPLMIAWPGTIAAGGLSHVPVISTDLYPTILALAGLPLRPQQHVDGVSLAPLLTGAGAIPERELFWHYPHYSNQGVGPAGAVRSGSLKLIEWFEDMRCELYDLAADPGERHDLAAEKPEQAAVLRERLHAWRREVDAAMPTPAPAREPGPHPDEHPRVSAPGQAAAPARAELPPLRAVGDDD